MSIIYNPFDDRIPPQATVGVESVITRLNKQITTSSLTLATLFQQDYPIETFNQPGRVFRYSLKGLYSGNTAVDTKQLQIVFAGVTVFDTGLLTQNDLAYWLRLEVHYRLSVMDAPLINSRAHVVLMSSGGGFSAAPTHQSQVVNGTSFTPTAAQSLVISARVQNAANSVSLDTMLGTML